MYDEFECMNSPIPKMSSVKRTAELKMILRSFLAQCGASCCEDENNKNILKCYSRLQNGMFVEQEIYVGDSDFVCYTNLSGHVNVEDIGAMSAAILTANEVNLQLKYGNFEVENKRGSVRFRSYYDPGNEICVDGLDRLMGEPLWAIETYGNWFF